MARPPHARERVLDAFEAILIEEGERAATLDATAKAAGVSKGGLLYHFASRDDLVAGLLERLNTLAHDDIERITSAPEGPVAYFLRTSVMAGNKLDRAMLAVARVAQGGSAASADALRRIRDSWAETLRPHVRDDTALDLVMLVSDGLYYNNTLDIGEESIAGPRPTRTRLDNLIALAVKAAS